MTAQEMDPREDHVRWVLANAREQSRREVDRNTVTMALELLDEARKQRDEIREAHRVEVAALIKGLGFVETGRDGRGSAPIYERGFRRVYAGGYDGWVAEASTSAGRSTVHFDGLGEALAYAVTADAEALTARLEAAERERETNAERCLEALDDIAKLLVERNAAQARADAAEAKLAALVEAATAVCEWDPARLEGNLYAEGLVADLGSLRNATKAARGTP